MEYFVIALFFNHSLFVGILIKCLFFDFHVLLYMDEDWLHFLIYMTIASSLWVVSKIPSSRTSSYLHITKYVFLLEDFGVQGRAVGGKFDGFLHVDIFLSCKMIKFPFLSLFPFTVHFFVQKLPLPLIFFFFTSKEFLLQRCFLESYTHF